MPRIASFELWSVDLPFRHAFKHAAAERRQSDSLFLQCTLDDGSIGFGESLPRAYVSGESRDGAVALLAERVLPRLIGHSFGEMTEVRAFTPELLSIPSSRPLRRRLFALPGSRPCLRTEPGDCASASLQARASGIQVVRR